MINGPINAGAGDAANRDRRRFFRADVPLKARFLTANGTEEPCLVSNVSAGGALLRTKHPPQMGAMVVLYIDRLGRFESKVIRSGQNSFAVSYEKKRARTQKTADSLTQIMNQSPSAQDRRKSPRIQHDAPAIVVFENGEKADCSIMDISLTGASIEISPRPALGAKLILGKMTAKVVRRHDKGVGLVFTGPSNRMDEVIKAAQAPSAKAEAAVEPDGAGFAQNFGRKGLLA